MYYTFNLLAAVSVATVMTSEDYLFLSHIAEFALSFGTTEEFEFRKEVFLETNAEIEAFESATSTVGHNLFSTWTAEEVNSLGSVKSHRA